MGYKMDILDYNNSPKQIQHMIRMCNTNIDGKKQIFQALQTIRGIGRRFSHVLLTKTNISKTMRAGELTQEQLNTLTDAITNPENFDVPKFMFNHQKDFSTGVDMHLIGNGIDANDRFALERGKKIKAVRECRRARGLKVRGQRTGSNGRGGRSVGVTRKK